MLKLERLYKARSNFPNQLHCLDRVSSSNLICILVCWNLRICHCRRIMYRNLYRYWPFSIPLLYQFVLGNKSRFDHKRKRIKRPPWTARQASLVAAHSSLRLSLEDLLRFDRLEFLRANTFYYCPICNHWTYVAENMEMSSWPVNMFMSDKGKSSKIWGKIACFK